MPSQSILHTAPAEDGLQKRCASRPKDFHGLCNRTLFLSLAIRDSGLVIFAAHIAFDYLPNVKDEPRAGLARLVPDYDLDSGVSFRKSIRKHEA